MYGISTINTVISGKKNILVQMFSGWRRVWQSSQGGGGKYSANVQWLEEGVWQSSQGGGSVTDRASVAVKNVGLARKLRDRVRV